MWLQSHEPAVVGGGQPQPSLAVPVQLQGDHPPVAVVSDGPFCRITALARTLLAAPVAFVALAAAPRFRWPTRACACPPGPLADAFRRTILTGTPPPAVDDVRTDPRTRDHARVTGTGVTAWLCHPVTGPAGETLGTFCVLDTAARAWTARDLEIVAGLAHAAAGEHELHDDAALAARDAQRLTALSAQTATLARALQDSLLPPHLPDVPGLQVAARYLPATDGLGVLGDFYDVFPGPRRHGPGRQGVPKPPEKPSPGESRGPRPFTRRRSAQRWDAVIGDVCGHGVEAATLASLARYTIRAVATRERAPARVLGGLNDALLAQRPDSERFLTAVYVMLFPNRGRVTAILASAGHTPALLRDAGGTVRAVGRHGLPLGLFEAPDLSDTRLSLKPGDTLLLYTDGVTEARRGGEQFGERRLRDLLSDAGRLSAHDLASAVEREVLAFTGGRHGDDIAVLALRVTDGGRSRRRGRRPPRA